MIEIKISKSSKNLPDWNYLKNHFKLYFLKPGMIIKYKGKIGFIVKAAGEYLEVYFSESGIEYCWPISEITYFGEGRKVLKSFPKVSKG